MLLEKDPKLRPSVAQIIQMNMVKAKMTEFVTAQGSTLQRGKTIYRKQNPIDTVKQEPNIDPNETPKQRMARKKAEEADQRKKELN